MQSHYADLQTVRERLMRRQSMRGRVEEWWEKRGWPIPTIFTGASDPIACLLRHVATARYEDILFSLMAHHADLIPVWGELTRDVFSHASPFKRSLVRREIACGKIGHPRVRKERLVPDLNALSRRPLREIQTTNGRSLIDVHHELQETLVPGPVQRFDVSSLYEAQRLLTPADYYPYLFSWFIAHGVLFEDFHGGESGTQLGGFTTTVVEPAWRMVRQQFDLEPLIIKLPWWRELGYYPADRQWESYGGIPSHQLHALGLA